jgi:hypothetical protein
MHIRARMRRAALLGLPATTLRLRDLKSTSV